MIKNLKTIIIASIIIAIYFYSPLIFNYNNNKEYLDIFINQSNEFRNENIKLKRELDSIKLKLVESNRKYYIYRGLYFLNKNNNNRQDLFVWDPDENKGYYTFFISNKRLRTVYDVGKKFNIDKENFNSWMSIPYLETTYGAHNNTIHIKDTIHTHIISWADAHGLMGILPRTAYSILTTKMGYDSSLTYNDIVSLLATDSINIEIAAHFCNNLGFDRITYVHGPIDDLNQYEPWKINYIKPKFSR